MALEAMKVAGETLQRCRRTSTTLEIGVYVGDR